MTRVGLSKIDDYLVDNVCCSRLSDLGHAVNDKAWWGTEGSGNSPRSRKPVQSNDILYTMFRQMLPLPRPLRKRGSVNHLPGLSKGRDLGRPTLGSTASSPRCLGSYLLN